MKLINKSLFSLSMTICLLCSYNAWSQTVEKTDSSTIFLYSELPETPDFLSLLVSKAEDYFPGNNLYNHNIKIAEKEKALARYDFLNHVMLRGNLNEFTIDPPEGANPAQLFYPRYNLGVSFSLGTFFTQPINKKIAKENLAIREEEKEIHQLELKGEVLSRYMNFKSAKNILLIQTKALEDSYSRYTIIEEQFKNEQVTFEEYLDATVDLNNQKIKKVNAEKDYDISMIQIEQLIGQKIEDLIREYIKSCAD